MVDRKGPKSIEDPADPTVTDLRAPAAAMAHAASSGEDGDREETVRDVRALPKPADQRLVSTDPGARRQRRRSILQRSAQTFGPFRLHERLGTAGITESFLASRQGDAAPAPCVVKRLLRSLLTDRTSRAAFADEARIGRWLRHENVLSQVADGDVDGVPYLCLEFIDGMSLWHLVRLVPDRRLPVRPAIVVGARVATGLDYLHALTSEDGTPLRLVHRDVIPENILLSREGRVKLSEFGIAKYEGRASQTDSGISKGKLRFMAPEQLSARFDSRADLYALGLVLAEALTARILVRPGEILAMDVPDRVRSAGRDCGVPEPLIDVLATLVAPDPDQRPPTSGEAGRLLEAAVPPGPGDAELVGLLQRTIMGQVPPIGDEGFADLVDGLRMRPAVDSEAGTDPMRPRAEHRRGPRRTSLGLLVADAAARPPADAPAAGPPADPGPVPGRFLSAVKDLVEDFNDGPAVIDEREEALPPPVDVRQPVPIEPPGVVGAPPPIVEELPSRKVPLVVVLSALAAAVIVLLVLLDLLL